MARCKEKTKSGERCPFTALPDSPDGAFCYHHDPKRKEERQEAAKKGGRPKGIKRNILTVHDVQEVLSETINMVFEGKLETKDAQAIASLSNSFIATLKMIPKEKQTKKAKSKKAETEEAMRRIREIYGMSEPEIAN